eukprot:3693461-Pleurochrysis_carterae.AAC.1
MCAKAIQTRGVVRREMHACAVSGEHSTCAARARGQLSLFSLLTIARAKSSKQSQSGASGSVPRALLRRPWRARVCPLALENKEVLVNLIDALQAAVPECSVPSAYAFETGRLAQLFSSALLHAFNFLALRPRVRSRGWGADCSTRELISASVSTPMPRRLSQSER